MQWRAMMKCKTLRWKIDPKMMQMCWQSNVKCMCVSDFCFLFLIKFMTTHDLAVETKENTLFLVVFCVFVCMFFPLFFWKSFVAVVKSNNMLRTVQFAVMLLTHCDLIDYLTQSFSIIKMCAIRHWNWKYHLLLSYTCMRINDNTHTHIQRLNFFPSFDS